MDKDIYSYCTLCFNETLEANHYSYPMLLNPINIGIMSNTNIHNYGQQGGRRGQTLARLAEKKAQFTPSEIQDLLKVTRYLISGSKFKYKGIIYTLAYGGATCRSIKVSGTGNHKEILIKK